MAPLRKIFSQWSWSTMMGTRTTVSLPHFGQNTYQIYHNQDTNEQWKQRDKNYHTWSNMIKNVCLLLPASSASSLCHARSVERSANIWDPTLVESRWKWKHAWRQSPWIKTQRTLQRTGNKGNMRHPMHHGSANVEHQIKPEVINIMMIRMGWWLDDRIMVPLVEQQLAGKTLQYKPHLGQAINAIVELEKSFSDAHKEEFEEMKLLR